jgi:hypothetical protein
MYGKLGTRYGKKWHVMREGGVKSPSGLRYALCGYGFIEFDKYKSRLESGDQLCQTCMLVRAHSKQKLNRGK